MTTITSKDAQNHFGQLIDSAQREPVVIERRGRPIAVVISRSRYEALEALEDQMWRARAKKAAEGGFLSTEETMSVIKEPLDAGTETEQEGS